MELTQTQINQHTQIGYAFAFVTLGFLFCGVFVAHSVIEEQNNKVFIRLMLTKVSGKEYFISKFLMALIYVLNFSLYYQAFFFLKNTFVVQKYILLKIL